MRRRAEVLDVVELGELVGRSSGGRKSWNSFSVWRAEVGAVDEEQDAPAPACLISR